MVKLSVVIAAKDEENNIKKRLDSIKDISEIVVGDDVSTDRAVSICKEYTDKIFVNNNQGSFDKNKNFA